MYDHAHTFQGLQITRADIRPQVRWAVNLVIADCDFSLPQGLCVYVWANILTLPTPEGIYC